MAVVGKEKLRNVALFEGLGDAELQRLSEMSVSVELPAGELLVEESAKGNDVYAILTGRVVITIAIPNGDQAETLAVLQDGETLGESILLGRTRRIASAEAQSEVAAAKWNNEQLMRYFDDNPRAGYIVMRNLARTLQERLSSTNMMLRNTVNRVVDIL